MVWDFGVLVREKLEIDGLVVARYPFLWSAPVTDSGKCPKAAEAASMNKHALRSSGWKSDPKP